MEGKKGMKEICDIPPNVQDKQRSRFLAYVRWSRRCHWLIPLVYIFLVLIPDWYELRTTIPSFENLRETQGAFFYKHVGKRGDLIGIKTELGDKLFTCRLNLTFGNNHDCLSPLIDLNQLTGKSATVWSFEQEIYPFDKQDRLMKLVVDGKELVSVSNSVQKIEGHARSTPWWNAGYLIFVVFMVCYVEFKIFRKIEKP